MKLSDQFTKRERHDEAYEGAYVAGDQAIDVERSDWDSVANMHREELAGREFKEQPDGERGIWVQFFGNTHQNGFFHGNGWLW
jgi:hypothetical protein